MDGSISGPIRLEIETGSGADELKNGLLKKT